MARQRTKGVPEVAPGRSPVTTTGGPAAASQPIRVPSGLPYGERQALENQEKGAPMAVAGQPPTPAGQAQPAPQGPPPDRNALLAPSTTPGVPIGGGQPSSQIIPEDPDLTTRLIYQVYPHPEIARLLRGITS